MGKKSRRNKGNSSNAMHVSVPTVATTSTTNDTNMDSTLPAAAAAAAAPVPKLHYPSDGPMDVELLQTESTSLQAKLNQLTQLAVANDRAGFVQQFVPLDLSPADAQAYLEDLTTAPEAAGQWANLASEIAAIAAGRGVDRIAGDQKHRAVFFFEHPLMENCDREVSFVCVNGEWRAEG